MSTKPRALPCHPKNPDRVCWGCDKYCPADDLACGNGTIRTQHPAELFGDDWMEWMDSKRHAAPEHDAAIQTDDAHRTTAAAERNREDVADDEHGGETARTSRRVLLFAAHR